MTDNLLDPTWADADLHELRLLLAERIGGPGQYSERTGTYEYYNTLFLPLAGKDCRIALGYCGNRIVSIKRGEAFDPTQWCKIAAEFNESILNGPPKVGREFSFSSFRVLGSWRGNGSGIQILPPPKDAPLANVEMAEHPFVLEFPIRSTDVWPITNYRRMREHRRLTLLLNVLLAGHTTLEPRRPKHFWAFDPSQNGSHAASRWVQQFYSGPLGQCVCNELSQSAAESLEEVSPSEYYTSVGHDGKGLRVPMDLDTSISRYKELPTKARGKFDRAIFWLEMASQQWETSVSLAFVCLVSAVEALLNSRGTGISRKLKAFLERYAAGGDRKCICDEFYRLRSDIVHGSDLVDIDQDHAFGWDPSWENQRRVIDGLWLLSQLALRNWLKDPSARD